MDKQQQLQELLEMILGSPHVYYQPPASAKMVYPAIVFALDDVDSRFAGNLPYSHADRYLITMIEKSPVTELRHKVAALPTASFSARFVADNLNHTVYSLYF